ncbi:MAG: HD domain-containing phosphohydrolase, partial [bacterium]
MALPQYRTSAMRVEEALEEGYGIGETLLTSGFTAMVIAGEHISVAMDYVLGWEPVGREMEVTLEKDVPQADRIGETTIRLIDGVPALEIYRKYLGVEWNESFIMNVCEFPLMVEQNGVKICLVPMDSHHGNLTVIGNIEETDKLRFSYSTREEILREARRGSERMVAFAPDAVIMSLCGNRINFLRQDAHLEWDYYRERNPSLVFCHGQCEIAYEKGRGGVLNSALVAVGLRECEKHTEPVAQMLEPLPAPEQQGYIPLGYRVSHFFHVMTEELVHLQHNLEDEVEKKTRENEGLSFHVVQTLAEAIDAKDTYTHGHSGRVARYAREIARRAGMSVKRQNEIFIMGLLHDVGKIGVPDAVINKPGKLTDEEFALMKTHPATGARILSKIQEMPGLAVGAHWHHERMDGRGYPDGLRGEEIPVEARIIAVADAYDAMTSNRSYRGAMPQEKVREQVERGLGTQFDPVFGAIMLKMIEEDTAYRMREM